MTFIEKFFETERFNDLIEIIDKNAPISQESLLYERRKILGLLHDDFRDVVQTVLEKFPNHVQRVIPKVEPQAVFGDFYVDYKGLRFNCLIGQGSSYSITRAT